MQSYDFLSKSVWKTFRYLLSCFKNQHFYNSMYQNRQNLIHIPTNVMNLSAKFAANI